MVSYFHEKLGARPLDAGGVRGATESRHEINGHPNRRRRSGACGNAGGGAIPPSGDCPSGQRQTRLERHLAGAELGQLRPGAPHGPRFDAASRRPPRAAARCPLAAPRRRGRRSGRHGRRRGRQDPLYARKRRPKGKKTARTGSTATPRSNATCRACRGRTTCRSPFRSFTTKTRYSSPTNSPAPPARYTLRDVGPAETDSWMGQSVGRWEGDTLVVEVSGLSDQTWLDRSGTHHSYKMRVTERYTPAGPQPSPIRSRHRRPGSLHAALENQHAALPAASRKARG